MSHGDPGDLTPKCPKPEGTRSPRPPRFPVHPLRQLESAAPERAIKLEGAETGFTMTAGPQTCRNSGGNEPLQPQTSFTRLKTQKPKS